MITVKYNPEFYQLTQVIQIKRSVQQKTEARRGSSTFLYYCEGYEILPTTNKTLHLMKMKFSQLADYVALVTTALNAIKSMLCLYV